MAAIPPAIVAMPKIPLPDSLAVILAIASPVLIAIWARAKTFASLAADLLSSPNCSVKVIRPPVRACAACQRASSDFSIASLAEVSTLTSFSLAAILFALYSSSVSPILRPLDSTSSSSFCALSYSICNCFACSAPILFVSCAQ